MLYVTIRCVNFLGEDLLWLSMCQHAFTVFNTFSGGEEQQHPLRVCMSTRKPIAGVGTKTDFLRLIVNTRLDSVEMIYCSLTCLLQQR